MTPTKALVAALILGIGGGIVSSLGCENKYQYRRALGTHMVIWAAAFIVIYELLPK